MTPLLPKGKIIKLNTGLRPSPPLYLGRGIMSQLNGALESYDPDKLFLVTDPAVYDIYGKRLLGRLKRGYKCEPLLVPRGEMNKNIDTLTRLCENALSKGVSKGSILLAFGGGVVGNLTGLAAAMLYRGIRFAEIPTTLLAQTDSALSNKQAVNSSIGKNHLGAYHAPIFIWSDTDLLLSEKPARIRSGLVESVKNGLISDPGFLRYLDKKLKPRARYSAEDLAELVFRSIKSKANILRKDPTEKRFAVILEYGHTFGHAIEKLGRGRMSHGEAVAAGMVIAAEVSHALGHLSRGDLELHYRLLRDRLAINFKIPKNIKAAKIVETMKSDNKRSSEGVKYVLLRKPGRVLNPDGDYMVHADGRVVRGVINRFASK